MEFGIQICKNSIIRKFFIGKIFRYVLHFLQNTGIKINVFDGKGNSKFLNHPANINHIFDLSAVQPSHDSTAPWDCLSNTLGNQAIDGSNDRCTADAKRVRYFLCGKFGTRWVGAILDTGFDFPQCIV